MRMVYISFDAGDLLTGAGTPLFGVTTALDFV